MLIDVIVRYHQLPRLLQYNKTTTWD